MLCQTLLAYQGAFLPSSIKLTPFFQVLTVVKTGEIFEQVLWRHLFLKAARALVPWRRRQTRPIQGLFFQVPRTIRWQPLPVLVLAALLVHVSRQKLLPSKSTVKLFYPQCTKGGKMAMKSTKGALSKSSFEKKITSQMAAIEEGRWFQSCDL